MGIGPGAHGRRLGRASFRRKKPENWLSALTRNGHGMESETALSPQDKATEALLMGLRLEEGVDLARISSLSGVATGALVDSAAVERLSADRKSTRLNSSH